MEASIGKRIRAARKSAGLTQVQTAEAMSVDQTSVSAWERGQGPQPRLDQVERLAGIFGVDRGWLAWGVGDGPSIEAA